MAKKIIYRGTLMDDLATQTPTALTWSDVDGVLPPSQDTPTSADAYMFVLNGVEYQPNYFLDGDTKLKCAYRVDNVDTIMLEYIKSTGYANIKLRTDKGLNLNEDGVEYLEFYEKLPSTHQHVIINLAGESAMVTYDGENFTIEKI